MKVEELKTYGKAFDYMPLKAQLLQLGVMLKELNKKFGLWGMVGFLKKVSHKSKELKNEYAKTIDERFPGLPASVKTELYSMSAIYYLLTELEDKEKAYVFIKMIFQRIGPTAHSALYCLKNLRKCPGDIYNNFCQLNGSIFEGSAQKGYYTVEKIQNSADLQYIKLTKCLNVDVFSVLGCRELGRLGCDIDIAGYAPEAIGNQVNLDFRRPSTIANGDPSCEFYYYRKGCAPNNMETI